MDETDNSFIILPTLDHGMEWCENKILAGQGITDLTGFIERMEGQLKRAFPGLQAVDRLMKYLERNEVPQGEYLMHQGDPPTEMYFVEGGLVERPAGGARWAGGASALDPRRRDGRRDGAVSRARCGRRR